MKTYIIDSRCVYLFSFWMNQRKFLGGKWNHVVYIFIESMNSWKNFLTKTPDSMCEETSRKRGSKTERKSDYHMLQLASQHQKAIICSKLSISHFKSAHLINSDKFFIAHILTKNVNTLLFHWVYVSFYTIHGFLNQHNFAH